MQHAAASKLTEQPSFYMVLCGGKEGTFKNGPNHCIYKPTQRAGGYGEGGDTELDVMFLDRNQYPNGASAEASGEKRKYWDIANVRNHPDHLVILHNNWIKGLADKVGRMVEQKLWYYARDEMVCRYETDSVFTYNWAKQYPETT